MKAKGTKTLVASLIAIVICFTTLLGTTFAWFTDSISSNGNIIASGKLDVNAYWMDATKDPTNADNWVEFNGEPIFNYSNWEPGYVEAKHLKVTNEGSLAFKFKLAIEPNGAVSKLADVIEVYYFANATQLNARSEILNGVKVGTLAELIADPDGAAYGILLPEGESSSNANEVEKEVAITIAFKMEEALGDEYQGLSIGTDFDIVVYATQYTYENDSFGNDYDADASIDDAIFAHGGVVELEGNITDTKTIAEGASVVMNMNDNTMSNTLINKGEVVINQGTIETDKVGFENSGTATLTEVTMNAGSAVDYSNITKGENAETTYDNVTLNSAGGGVGVVDGATVTFNSGTVGVNSKSTSGRYLFYLEGEGSELTINEGEFDFDRTQNQKRAYIYASEGTTVYVKGGTFGKASTRSGYTAGILGSGTVIITGGTFGFDPSTWVPVGYEAVKENGVWTVSEVVDKSAKLDEAIIGGETEIVLGTGNYIMPDSAKGKTLTIIGNGDTNIATQDDGSYEGCDYSLDGATVTFKNVTINTDSSTYTGYARLNATYENCTINGTYTLYGESVFKNCTFNVSGDVYNIWTWGAPNATFDNCTFNSDGKAMLLYGTENTKLTLNNCTFNDNGGLTDLKAAVEIGNDYGKSYELIVNNAVVNGYEINDKGINTGSTLWANKNSMGTDKLNVVIDGIDVY